MQRDPNKLFGQLSIKPRIFKLVLFFTEARGSEAALPGLNPGYVTFIIYLFTLGFYKMKLKIVPIAKNLRINEISYVKVLI